MLVCRQGVGVVTSWRAFLARLKGMVVATVAGVTVVVDRLVAEGRGVFDEQPATRPTAANGHAAQAIVRLANDVGGRVTGTAAL